MDNYKSDKHLVKYVKINRNGATCTYDVCLSEKIRHIIHHPENKHNAYTDEELSESIKAMREFILAQV